MTEKNVFTHTGGHSISYRNAEIYTEQIGNPESPLLLMLHGGFGTIEDFNIITPALCGRFRLIAIDSRGHGKSTLGFSGLSYKILEDDLAYIIDTLALKEFSILGFSDGGITAYRYAARQPSGLQKIITIGSSWEMNENETAWEMISEMTGDIWKETFPDSYNDYMRLNPEADFERFASAVLGMWKDLSPEGHPENMMNDIRNEMLVIRGDNDLLTSAESMVRLQKNLKNVNFLNIPFADHVAFADAPDIFLSAVARFFNISFENKQNSKS